MIYFKQYYIHGFHLTLFNENMFRFSSIEFMLELAAKQTMAIEMQVISK